MHDDKFIITKLFGTEITLNIPSAILTVFTCFLTFVIVMILTSRIKLRPDNKRQNFMEMIAVMMKGTSVNNVKTKKYADSLWSLGLSLVSFLVVANILGVFFEIRYGDVVWVNSITADPSFTLTLAATLIIFTHYYGIKKRGLKHYFGTYASTGVFLIPLKILEEFVNILTLSLRIYGNIFAGEVLLGLLGTAVLSGIIGSLAIFGLLAWQAFSVFVGFIQAYIFTTMFFVYLSHKVDKEH